MNVQDACGLSSDSSVACVPSKRSSSFQSEGNIFLNKSKYKTN